MNNTDVKCSDNELVDSNEAYLVKVRYIILTYNKVRFKEYKKEILHEL